MICSPYRIFNPKDLKKILTGFELIRFGDDVTAGGLLRDFSKSLYTTVLMWLTAAIAPHISSHNINLSMYIHMNCVAAASSFVTSGECLSNCAVNVNRLMMNGDRLMMNE